jgi:rhodanese-related sulfurtransferase
MKTKTKKERYIDYLYLIAMAAIAVWVAYGKGWIFADFESVDAKKAVTMLRDDTNVTVVDVRTPKEYASGHVKGAISLPLGRLEDDIATLTPYKTHKLIVYCRSGNRSIAASRILTSHGFTPVNVKGGIIALAQAGAHIVK